MREDFWKDIGKRERMGSGGQRNLTGAEQFSA